MSYRDKSQKEYSAEYYKKNRDSILEKNKKWCLDNIEKCKNTAKAYRQKHIDKINKRSKEFGLSIKGRFGSMKNAGNQRGYPVTLTLEEFSTIISNPCRYCGEDEKRIAIDRIDSTKGYTLANSAPCCKICNTMKLDMTVDDFFKHITKIINNKKI